MKSVQSATALYRSTMAAATPPRFMGNFYCLGRLVTPVRAECDTFAATNAVAVTAIQQMEGRRDDDHAAGCSESGSTLVSGYVLTGRSALFFLERIGVTINPNQATHERVKDDIHRALRERYGPGYPYNDEFFRMVRSESQRLDQGRNRDEGDARVVRNLTRL